MYTQGKGFRRGGIRSVLFILWCIVFPIPTQAATSNDMTDNASANQMMTAPTCHSTTDCLAKIAQYIKSLGAHLGYILTSSLDDTVSSQLLDAPPLLTLASHAIQTYLGALTSPTLALSANAVIKYFVISPTDATQSGAFMNSSANKTFEALPVTSYSSNTTATQPSSVTTNTSTLTNQQPYQVDPVTQTLLNLIATPPAGYCAMHKNNQTSNNTACLDQGNIISNTITLPKPLQGLYQFNNVYSYLPQLNANMLLTPLIISTSASSSDASSPNSITVDQAATFIRYVSNTMIPISLPDYTNIITMILNTKDPTQQTAMTNQVKLFIATLNTYFSQLSVGLSNLYYILSKRIAQSTGQTPLASQAYNEYKMATWRLLNTSNPDASWIKQMNTASSATIQKEIAILLAEINYQLYLSREQQERLLLTNNVLLLVSQRNNLPTPDSLIAHIKNAAQGSSNGE